MYLGYNRKKFFVKKKKLRYLNCGEQFKQFVFCLNKQKQMFAIVS